MGKRFLALFLAVVFLVSLAACAADMETESAEAAAQRELSEEEREELLQRTWQQLSKSELHEIVGSWEDAAVAPFAISGKEAFYYVEPEFSEAELFLVTFESENEELLGKVEKIVEGESYCVVGYNFRQ